MLRKQVYHLFAIPLLLLTLLVSALPVSAQRIIIDPPILPPVPVQQSPIAIDLHSIDAVVDGPVATVHVTQIFHNISGVTVEGKYVFPLPADATVSDFQMTVDGQVMVGKLYTAEEARRIYEEIVRSLRDPALLEYLGNNLFQASVFPIPAGATRKVELTYTQVLPTEEGLYHLHLPLGAAQTATAKVDKLAIRIELRNQPGLRTVYSPNFNLDIQRQGDTGALIGYEAAAASARGDFDLYFGADNTQIGVNLLSYKPSGEDGYFLLLAAPSVDVAEAEIVTRDVVLVLDTSGSMQGEKIEQARKAVRYVVDHLNPGDRFNLISFSTGTRLWQSSLQEVNATTLANARGWIDQITASGSTDINRALLEALAQFSGDQISRDQISGGQNTAKPAYLLFLTDGLPTQGEIDSNRILANVSNNLPAEHSLRLFSFGVGYDVNTDLLDTLSGDLGGRTTYVKPDEAIDETVGNFYAQIGKPVLADVKLDFGQSAVVDELYPYPLSDFFAGEQQVIVGRYRAGGSVDLTLSGNVNGKEVNFHYPGRTLINAGGEPFVARLWATRKIGALLTQIRRNGPQKELTDAIVELSLKYGIVTPYTSYLVQEPLQDTLQQVTPGEAPAPLLYSSEKAAADASLQIQAQTAEEASAAPSGESAVNASLARSKLRLDTVIEAPRENLQFAGGRTFTYQGTVNLSDNRQVPLWVDTAYMQSMKVDLVTFGSDRYFELAQQPELAAAFALSPEVVVVINADRAIRVTTADSAETQVESPLPTATPQPPSDPDRTASPTSVPIPTATSQPEEKGLWEKFWEWATE